ncbi:MAG: HNH nuclease [Bacteriophage sp.]|nr:MAG: HNH nuclease [Bacteriophage sp.]
MDIKYLYENTELTIQQIANQIGSTYKRVYTFVKKNYSSEYRKKRKSISYRNSKLGDKNPMIGKTLEQHHNYKGVVSDNKGYLMVVKPDWYTGRKRSKHIFQHHEVVCRNLGITEVPKGWNVHHCDINPLNNSFDNLVLLTMQDHMRLHGTVLKGATTISKESTLKWVETYGTPFKV